MPGTVKSELLSDADRSHKCDSQEKICRIRHLPLDKSHFITEEYIRFKGALIELGKVGNAFTAELSNEELAFKENGQKIAYISNQSLVITNAEIRNKLSLGNESRGWFDFIPRTNGNLSIKWRGPV